MQRKNAKSAKEIKSFCLNIKTNIVDKFEYISIRSGIEKRK
nr:MAG TPA: hypothetical protein [Caudoviricetes sp.]